MKYIMTEAVHAKYPRIEDLENILEQARVEVEGLKKMGLRGEIVSHAFDVPDIEGDYEFALAHVRTNSGRWAVEVDLSGGWVNADGESVDSCGAPLQH